MHTHFNSLNPSSYPHFTFHSIPDGLSQSEASTKDIVLLISLLNVKCVEPFRAALADLLSDDSKELVACLIADLRFQFTQSVADDNN
ncbi:UDP-glycosyltransferase 76F1-like [Prunus yedoensis var. nudiflora]|uniref:UDP-glycosyltransferase 76F1-like n=1 Tax=Prunus yedoensis var. nudiflora TaxID=2094558 RepID=A0A314XK93_PRUYE|nr:UDP-glycosyltransferase 76F1-like [Prunus yedoensis var. nudiflora]